VRNFFLTICCDACSIPIIGSSKTTNDKKRYQVGFLLTAVTAIGAAITGWKIANRRGQDPIKRPSFSTRGKYLRRCALLGAIGNFALTYGIWVLIGSFSIADGTQTGSSIALLALAPAAFFAPAGAVAGLMCGWAWHKLDVVRRNNHPEQAAISPEHQARQADQSHSDIPEFSSLTFPADIGVPRIQNTTGDSVWDDFYKAEAKGN
jgi:hypothetical protein